MTHDEMVAAGMDIYREVRNRYQAEYKAEVRALGSAIGYGNMMHLAQECWREELVARGGPAGGEKTVGPCAAMTVPCGCDHGCEWCGGCGWLTKRVKESLIAAEVRQR